MCCYYSIDLFFWVWGLDSLLLVRYVSGLRLFLYSGVQFLYFGSLMHF